MDNARFSELNTTEQVARAIWREDMTEDTIEVVHRFFNGEESVENKIFAPPGEYTCLCGQDHVKGYRSTEMASLLFSPNIDPEKIKNIGLQPDLVSIIERIRVIRRSRMNGEEHPDTECPLAVQANLKWALNAGSIQEVALATINAMALKNGTKYIIDATRDTNSGNNDIEIREIRTRMMSEIGSIINNEIIYGTNKDEREDANRNVPIFQNTIDTARKLTENVKKYAMEEMAAIREKEKEAKEGTPIEREERQPWYGWNGRLTLEDITKRRHKDAQARGAIDIHRDAQRALWGDVHMHTPTRSRKAKNTPIRKSTSRDEGTIPTAIHRFMTDGRIFKQPARRKGAISMLIDLSGSMSWGEEELKELLDKLPGSNIATYAGSNEYGILRIVAHKGYRVEPEHTGNIYSPEEESYLGGNTIDGPALRWLAKQPGPRIWISDGEVVGRQGALMDPGKGQISLKNECNFIMKKAGITRARNAGIAMDIISGRRPWGYYECP